MNDTTYLLQLSDYQNRICKAKSFDWKLVADSLRFLRQSKLRVPMLVARNGYRLVTNHFNNIRQHEVYDVVEQVILALLECGLNDQAAELIEKVAIKFGKTSVRVRRLQAMLDESRSIYYNANDTYLDILEKYPADMMSMKRQVSILKAKGMYVQAANLLNTFLQVYMGDFEAWLELASLHIRMLNYRNAAFCYEELILIQPLHHSIYVKYAEIMYSIGGADNYIIALKYYAHSLELNPSNLESENTTYPPTNLSAIYGIIMSIFAFCNCHGGSTSKLRPVQLELYEWAQGELKRITTKHSPLKLPLVSAFINATNVKQES
ncbi:hypothetical protein SAMD00019534_059520, partial [Acytostelium subglobosum LB1]|uniref:hypothetical protein n=1 Tax=Acytostelium subglobosum LB1 TaxID=1410327 RepID=UPI000644C4EC